MVNQIIKKIIATLLIIFTIITIGCFIRYLYLNKTIIPHYKAVTKDVVKKQVKRINSFLDKNEEYIATLSQDQTILEQMKLLIANTDIVQTTQKLSSHIAIHKEHIQFKNLFLITVDGTILFSTTPKAYNINLRDVQHQHTALSESFQRSIMTLTTDFSDFAFSPILDEKAFYVTKPLISDKVIIGVIVCQIDENRLQVSQNDYIDLKTTGEIVFGVAKERETFFILPTRNDPHRTFKTTRMIEENIDIATFEKFVDLPLQMAVLGGYASGIGYDYRDKKVIASWDLIPRIQWGIVGKIDFDEALEPLTTVYYYLIINLIITFILLLFASFIKGTNVHSLLHATIHNKIFSAIPQRCKNPLIIPFIIILYLSCTSIYTFKHVIFSAAETSKNAAIRSINQSADSIDSELDTVMLMANFIVQDLQTERLVSEDIKERIKRDILENENIEGITIAFEPYMIDSNTKLYAPSMYKEAKTIKEIMINESYDYTDAKTYGTKTDWYTKIISTEKAQWLNPQTIDNQNMTITYSLPFYYKKSIKPSGVVSIQYSLEKIIAAARDISIGKTGYSFLITKSGMLLYHPIRQLVADQKTLIQFAQEEGDEELVTIATTIREQHSLLKQYINRTTQKTMWIYTQSIQANDWTIGTIFSQRDIKLPFSEVRKHLFIIVAYITLTLLIALAILCDIVTIDSIIQFLSVSNIILIASILGLWYIISITHYIQNESSIRITTQSGLDTFISKQIDDTKRLNIPSPIPVPCGVILSSLEQTNPRHVSFSGYIWHKYHKTMHKDVKRSIHIPRATYFRVSNETKKIDGEWEIIGMHVIATVYHAHNYAYYPFDIHQIRISLEHTDFTKNILLVPDVAGYTTMNPEKMPGIDKTFSPSAFLIRETFFDLSLLKQGVNLGIQKKTEQETRYQLGFNAIMFNDFLNAFILFFLPLLVILISIFSIFILEKRTTDPYIVIGPYTGLLFGLVLLHRSLHEAAPSDNTIYMEYAFFFTYIVIILLVIHTILAQYYINWEFYQKKFIPFFKALFWPMQLTSWIITTLVMFY